MTTILQVARMFEVGRETVKCWTIEFADHLSAGASHPRGNPRAFSEEDIRVLAFVYYYWEEKPDYEHIHAMLNSGDHLGEMFVDHARLYTPIFQEVPSQIDETWNHGAVIGGIAFRDRSQVARSYKLAADRLLEVALKNDESHELHSPIIFLYRHTIELYLKAALQRPPEHHDLNELSCLLEQEAGGQLPEWLKNRVVDFHKIDRKSCLFRYADDGPSDELWIDFQQLRTVVDKFVEAFERYLMKQWAKI